MGSSPTIGTMKIDLTIQFGMDLPDDPDQPSMYSGSYEDWRKSQINKAFWKVVDVLEGKGVIRNATIIDMLKVKKDWEDAKPSPSCPKCHTFYKCSRC